MLLKIGKVLSTKGLGGEIKATFFYSKLVPKKDDNLFFEKEKNIFGPYKVLYSKHYKVDKVGRNVYILKLDTIEDITKSEVLTKSVIGQEIEILPENIFLTSELKKCKLLNIDNEIVGDIVDVVQVRQGYSLLIVRKNSGEEIYVPFVKEVIDCMDINNKKGMLKNVSGILDAQR